MKALKWETIGGIPLTPAVQKFWRPVLSKALRLPFADRVPLNQTTFYVTTRRYRLNRVWGTFYLCFNPRQQVDLRGSRREEIAQAQQRLREGKTIKSGLEKFFHARGELLLNVLHQAEEFDGYSCIFSTRPRPKAELVRLYFDKDVVEKAFRSLKGVVRESWKEQNLAAKAPGMAAAKVPSGRARL